MSNLRTLILALGMLVLAAEPCAAQRDSEKPPPSILQPLLADAPTTEKVERPAPILPIFVAVSSALLVLYIVCKPSRKGLPS